MSGSTFKAAIIAAVLLGTASTASAADVFTEALALTEGQSRAVSDSRYIKLSESLDMATAKEIDAAITSRFGDPEIQRSGLKVWEIANPDHGPNTADKITITCGIEDGKIQISIDGRLPANAPDIERKAQTPVPIGVQFRSSRLSPTPEASTSDSRLKLRPQNSDR
ncbi:hypothetical protein [Litorimonas sp. WD9-15]|uniref:hypothetical protein n=1 Tax=Litorimonas sp. WD9-15 TaxID=3418716 RepID=UPI003D04AD5B